MLSAFLTHINDRPTEAAPPVTLPGRLVEVQADGRTLLAYRDMTRPEAIAYVRSQVRHGLWPRGRFAIYHDGRRIDGPARGYLWARETQNLVCHAAALREGDVLAGHEDPITHAELNGDGEIEAWIGDAWDRFVRALDQDDTAAEDRIYEQECQLYDPHTIVFLGERGPEPRDDDAAQPVGAERTRP